MERVQTEGESDDREVLRKGDSFAPLHEREGKIKRGNEGDCERAREREPERESESDRERGSQRERKRGRNREREREREGGSSETDENNEDFSVRKDLQNRTSVIKI